MRGGEGVAQRDPMGGGAWGGILRVGWAPAGEFWYRWRGAGQGGGRESANECRGSASGGFQGGGGGS